MADVAIAPNPEPIPSSHQTTYSATSNDNPLPPPPTEESSREPPTSSSGLHLPSFITSPIESVLGTLGKIAASATSLLSSRGQHAFGRARPWLEFFDLSAFKPADGLTAYFDRIRVNIVYFLFNYIIFGLVLSVFSVVTKPVALIGAALLIWVYFQFFGAETAEDDFTFFGFSLDTHEKIGVMVILGFVFFWLTAGGFQIFFSVLTASVFVALIHGAFRKPSPDALTDAPPSV